MGEEESTDSPKVARSLSLRAERSLKEADRLIKSTDGPAHQRTMAQLAQARAFAVLDLADAIRETRKH